MKTIKTFAIAIVISALNYGLVTAQASKVTSQWEPSFNKEIGKNAVYQHFLGEDQNSFYVLMKKRSGSRFNRTSSYTITKWKKSFQQEKAVELKGLDIQKVYFIKNETFVLALEHEGKNSHVSFYKFNKGKMTFESVANYFSGIELNNFDELCFSPDSSKILLRTSPKRNLNEKEVFLLFTFDSDFNKLWQKEVVTPFQHTNFEGANDRTNFVIDNDGTVFMAGRIYKDVLTKKSKEKEIAYNYVILKVLQNSENQQLELKEKGLFYNKCFLGINKSNQLFAAGFFSDISDLSKTGAYYLTVNNEFTEVSRITFKDIPLQNITYNRKITADRKEIEKGVYTRYKDFKLNTVLFDANGDILLGIEDIRAYSITISSQTSITTRTDYYFHDIYIFKINADGELAWLQRIPKVQWSMDDDVITANFDMYKANRWSYQAFFSKGNVIVLYNDRPQNLKLTSDAVKGVKQAEVEKCPAVVVTFDKNGNMTKELAQGLSVKDLKLQTEFGKFERISNNRGFVTARKKWNTKMGFISVK